MIELDNDNYSLMNEGLVLVDFWSPICKSCMALMPKMETLESIYGDKIKFTSLNKSQLRKFSIGKGITGLPTIAIYNNGVMIEKVEKEDATVENIIGMIDRQFKFGM